MANKKPRVSVGMPVFNGEKYLRQSIESILSQTFEDFELIISDNASNDQTKEICKYYSAKDSRVKCLFNQKNIGAPKNYNRVYAESSGEFFKWAAYDDIHAPDYLKKCVTVLDRDKSIIGCHCKTGIIDQNGNLLGYYNDGLLRNIHASKPHQRLRELISLYYKPTPFHGLYRKSCLAKSQLHGSYIGADRNLVAELGLIGRIYEIPECLFFWREHPDSYTSVFYGTTKRDTLDSLRSQITWWSKDNGTYFIHWKNCTEYFKSVDRISLGSYERLLCYGQILDWFLEEGYKFMAGDVIMFLNYNSAFARELIKRVPLSLKQNSPLNLHPKQKFH